MSLPTRIAASQFSVCEQMREGGAHSATEVPFDLWHTRERCRAQRLDFPAGVARLNEDDDLTHVPAGGTEVSAGTEVADGDGGR